MEKTLNSNICSLHSCQKEHTQPHAHIPHIYPKIHVHTHHTYTQILRKEKENLCK